FWRITFSFSDTKMANAFAF
ncbi:hypothetical protein BVZ80_01055B, partial [Haemophilus influenzae]